MNQTPSPSAPVEEPNLFRIATQQFQIAAAAERYGTDMRTGAYILAVSRVAEATHVRGIFP